MFRILLIILSSWLVYSCHHSSDLYVPEANRFEFADLTTNLNEPMELDFLPDEKIIFIERRGIVKVHDQRENITRVIGQIPVSYVAESGLLGIAVDPNYINNNWVYFFYTDADRKAYHNISRFQVRNDSLLLDSEQKLLDFYYDYKHCCHNGGGLKFGPDGLLYISTGDNVGGTDYGPMDERPGRHLQDAQRTAANTMDYRGKILRIRPEADGSYSIPEGNLFEPNNPKALPEIYIMGVRNPWKINVDQKHNWLHWGEVGPNPGVRDPKRGPDAHEEFNLAKEAGNYGWPYFNADNKAYAKYDYATGNIGDFFDPQSIRNSSPNNKGLNDLPPAKKATIWYPNTKSDSFPLLGIGGGSAVGGPIFHKNQFAKNAQSFPEYYENHWFIADWMRGWIFAAKLDEDGNYVSMEAFLDGQPFKKPIDLEFGPDGSLYVLDYGSNWYAHNKDARLTKITYNYHNRPPKAIIKAEKIQSAVPVQIEFSANKSFDPDDRELRSYQWYVDNLSIETIGPNLLYKFSNPGNPKISLVVTDSLGFTDTTHITLALGNEPPTIGFTKDGNQSFYDEHHPFNYEISISDNEDGPPINPSNIQADIRQIPSEVNLTYLKNTSPFEDPGFNYLDGKELIQNSDCYSCHAASDASVGPSWKEIADRYKDHSISKDYLTRKILLGGIGAWSDKYMSAHPQHTKEEIDQMVDYILALDEDIHMENAELTGSLNARNKENYFLISASYKDEGANGQPSIKSDLQRILRPYRISATTFEMSHRVVNKPYNEEGDEFAEIMLNGSYIGFREIDLIGINKVKLRIRSSVNWVRIEVHQNSSHGPLLGYAIFDIPKAENRWAMTDENWLEIDVPVQSYSGLKDLYFVFYSDRTEGETIAYEICQVEWIEFIKGDNL